MNTKNQLTLPRAVTRAVGDPQYFEVQALGGRIVLTPVRLQGAAAVRAKLAELAITDKDGADAVGWARRVKSTPHE